MCPKTDLSSFDNGVCTVLDRVLGCSRMEQFLWNAVREEVSFVLNSSGPWIRSGRMGNPHEPFIQKPYTLCPRTPEFLHLNSYTLNSLDGKRASSGRYFSFPCFAQFLQRSIDDALGRVLVICGVLLQ